MSSSTFTHHLRIKIEQYHPLISVLENYLQTIEASLLIIEHHLPRLKNRSLELDETIDNILTQADYSPKNLAILMSLLGNDYKGPVKGLAQEAGKMISYIDSILLDMDDLKSHNVYAQSCIRNATALNNT